MAKKKRGTKKAARTTEKTSSRRRAPASRASSREPTSTPRLPYCTVPGALRRFLALVPQKPKPAKVNNELLQTWELGGNNANSIIRVLKSIGLVTSSNDTTSDYEAFMHQGSGPAHLARLIRNVYRPLFEASHRPDQEPDEVLRNYFNIHSGGAEGTLNYQISTFKALCEHADFASDAPSDPGIGGGIGAKEVGTAGRSGSGSGASGPSVHIDLHIHLPPNKSSRDYQAMFEDIARYIYGRSEAPDE